jgi:hypothetical protein
MKFIIGSTPWNRDFELIYRPEEYSFDSVPRPVDCVSSVLVNDLELELSDEGAVICVTGLCPHPGWQVRHLKSPAASRRTLFVAEENWTPGISKRLTGIQEWPMFVDYDAGCICVGKSDLLVGGVEFAPGSIAVLESQKLVAIWLRPRSLPAAK